LPGVVGSAGEESLFPPLAQSTAKAAQMLILTGILSLAALVYLAYAMIRPERF
jgi:K+-transporting ATPase KdpF subunit